MMRLEDIFSGEEIALINQVYSPRNGNMVLGTAFRLDFFDKLGLFEESRNHFSRELGNPVPERQHAADYLKKEFAGKRVIELGPGIFGTVNRVLDFAALGVSEYIGVEPLLPVSNERKGGLWSSEEIREHFQNGPATICVPYSSPHRWEKLTIPVSVESTHGLAYLLTQPDESAVVFSSCVFREDVLTDVGLPPELARKYLHHLVNQIYRVTPRNRISIHADNTPYIKWEAIFERGGFKLLLRGTGQKPEANGMAATENSELSYVVGNGGIILKK